MFNVLSEKEEGRRRRRCEEGSGMVGCDIRRQQKRKKVVTDSQRQRQVKQEEGGLRQAGREVDCQGGRVSLGLLVPSVITSISHSQSFQSCSALS